MAVVSLPLSFNNSFWSQDYRKGLEVLFHKLEQGVAENDEIVAFIRERAIVEGNIASSLKTPPATGNASTGFSADDGVSLLMAFRGLQAESIEQGQAHAAVANDLHTLVADPFEHWAQGHKDKLKQAKSAALDGWVRSYEFAQEDIHGLKNLYLTKTRRADEAEDDARFAPNEVADKYTNSPTLGPRKIPNRQPTVSERIAQRLRDIGKAAAANVADSPKSEQVFDAGSDHAPSPIDKGKGKALDQEPELTASPPALSPSLPPTLTIVPPPAPEPLLLAGLPFTPSGIASLLTEAKNGLPLRPVKFPILGEYKDCFSGEDLVTWLRENVQVFDRNLDIAAAAAKDLTERENLLRRIGELGNAFENADDAFFQFRPQAFTFGQAPPPVNRSPLEQAASPIAENLAKTSSSFVNIVSKALNTNPAEPPFLRLRREADAADKDYRTAIRRLDRQRLGLEERIEDMLKALQKWETERLRAVKTVLLQYQGSLSSLRKACDTSVDRSATLVSSYNPDSDLNALIERYRTGPFRPTAHIYESVSHDESDVIFGIDLRKWAEGGWSTVTGGEEKKDQIPPMLTTLLTALIDKYKKYSDDNERRKTWIYEVPLTAVHHLRESLNAVPDAQDIPEDLLNKYDAPVIAAAVKLWLLELEPPIAMYESWDEIRKIYPTVGAKSNTESPKQEHFEAIQNALQKLPKVHLFVLDAVVYHFKQLIEYTETEEDDEVYLTKLALAVGRTILRPKVETELSIQDRHPTLFLIDLVTHYEQLMPPTLEKKKRESARKVPTRKRTAIVDMRMRRSKLSDTTDLKEIMLNQHHATQPHRPASRSSISSSTAPPLNPEQIKVQAPIAVDPKHQGMPAALRSGSLSSTSPRPPAGGFVAPPPPPPIVAPGPPPPLIVPPPPPVLAQGSGFPPRPQFKEPPPEFDDNPRPNFKEPPPEFDDGDGESSPGLSLSRSSSPAVSLQRSASTEASRVRGPRTTRGPRTPAGGRRDSYGAQNAPSHSPSVRGHGRTGSRSSITYNTGSEDRRSGSVSSFSRRTMASDAEDEVVGE